MPTPPRSCAGQLQSSFSLMARKPIQRLLFPPTSDDIPEQPDELPPLTKGTDHAVQDPLPPDDSGSSADAQPANPHPDSALDAGPARQPPQDQSLAVEGAAGADEAGQQREPDRERGPGDRPQRTGGFFAARFSAKRGRGVLPRRGHDVSAPTYATRVRAQRRPEATLFDSLPDDPPPASASPAGALSDGTVISPPGRASGNVVPPEGLPQVSACPDANAPGLGADSLA